MSKTDSNEQIDADILRCKADIRRARDIIPGAPPPSTKETRQKLKAQKTGEKTTQPADAAEISADKKKSPREDTVPIPIETIAAPKEPVPPPTEKVNKKEALKQPEPEQAISSQNNILEPQAEQIKPGKATSAGPENAEQEKGEIPRFDLAEEIMAEHRKITAIRRKAPDKRVEVEEPQVESTGYIREQPMPEPSEQQIIAEIVARDIEKLCSGDNSADSK